MADPWSVISQSPSSKDPWSVVGESPEPTPPRRTARHGLKGPDAIEKAELSKAMGQAPNSTFGEQFMGTITNAIPSAAAGAYSVATTNPLKTIKSIARGVADLPSDLVTDIKQGKFGKLTAQTLLLALPGIGSKKAAEWAEAANTAASSAAKRAAASGVPEAVGGVVAESLTPDIVKRIRARLNPKAVPETRPYSSLSASAQAAERAANPGVEFTQPGPSGKMSADAVKKMRYGGPAAQDYSPARPSARVGKTSGGAGDPGKKVVEVQHLGDMRINGRTPKPPTLYDAYGRVAEVPASGEAVPASPSPRGRLEPPETAYPAKTAPAVESPVAGSNSVMAKNARTIARKLKAAGMTPSQLESLGPEDIAEYAKQIGLSPGNAKALRQQALFELRRL